CGHQTIEGAPHLADAHLPVFDCANRNGKYGERFIHHTGHIKMMAATQPFISGAISKTINMPNEVTVDEVAEAYMMSWELGIKAMALYRDGSKASQPLSASSDDGDNEELAEDVAEALQEDAMVAWGKIPAGLSPTEAYANTPRPRFLLPARRGGFTQEARVGGHKVFLRTGEYEDGTLGEIFIDLAKEGATLRGVLASFAIAVSKGLQYGVPLEEFVDTFVFQTFEPRGMVEGHPNIKMANSIIDYMFRALGVEYLHRDELVQVPPDRSESDLSAPPKGLAAEAGQQLELTGAAKETEIDAQAAAAAFADGDLPADPYAPISSPGGGGVPSGTEGASVSSPSGGGGARRASKGEMLSNGPGAMASQREKTAVTAAGSNYALTADLAAGELMGDAPACSNCGHMTVRNGSCYVCLTCGDTTGCS
ncbi:MAG: vitamin B12-dependent ribonucleotide reductase, partial [Acidimicrobiia bacterium]|nr:vitamin B12-dependent ribonucleotide reductase [Acidimicrobiia bacterium]